MIIVELRGGLGNQMFQYACGKALSLKHNQPLLIDDSFLHKNQVETDEFTPRHYELDIFKPDAAIAGAQLVKSFETDSLANKTLKLLNLPYKKNYTEITGQDATQLDKITPPVLLKGYWQSEQYFKDYKNEIRQVFSFNIDSATEIKGITDQINETNSVSIHFRRGDYLTNPVAKKVLGALDLGYYTAAIQEIKSKIINPFFYIFSDDPEWVKKNLPVHENYQVIEGYHGDKTGYDLLLMSKCRHHIIANSSFSWWGAWLNANPDKIVIAPKRWFADEQLNASSTQLIPAEWIRV